MALVAKLGIIQIQFNIKCEPSLKATEELYESI